MLPPSERETYQTHIPCRSKALLLTLAPVSTCPAPPVSAAAGPAARSAASTRRTKGSARRGCFFCRRRVTTGPNTVVMKWVRLPVSASRKILCVVAPLVGVALLLPSTALGERQQLVRADLFQAGQELVFTVRTAEPVSLAKLDPRPDLRRPASRFLCLALIRSRKGAGSLLCLGGRKPHRRIGLLVTGADGEVRERRSLAATVKRPNPDKLVVSLNPVDADLTARRYRW